MSAEWADHSTARVTCATCTCGARSRGHEPCPRAKQEQTRLQREQAAKCPEPVRFTVGTPNNTDLLLVAEHLRYYDELSEREARAFTAVEAWLRVVAGQQAERLRELADKLEGRKAKHRRHMGAL